MATRLNELGKWSECLIPPITPGLNPGVGTGAIRVADSFRGELLIISLGFKKG